MARLDGSGTLLDQSTPPQAPSFVARLLDDGVQRVSLQDEKLLGWFFGPGESEFRRSVFGAMVERVELDAYVTRRCKRCNGVGFHDDDVAHSSALIANATKDRPTELDSEEWERYRSRVSNLRPQCSACQGEGYTRSRRRNRKAPRTGYRRCRSCYKGIDPDCPHCGGSGVLTVSVAFRTCSHHASAGIEPSSRAMDRYAVISRRLDRVPRQSVSVLQRYYGDDGARCGGSRHGRIMALYPLTATGRALLASAGSSPVSMGQLDRFSSWLLEDTSRTPNLTRRAALARVDSEARELYRAAVEAWNATPRRRLSDH